METTNIYKTKKTEKIMIYRYYIICVRFDIKKQSNIATVIIISIVIINYYY
jgi:hypothetical protein